MSKIYHGSNQVTRMYVGTQEILKMYEGSTLLWEKPAGTNPPVVRDATIRSTTSNPLVYNNVGTKTIDKPAGTVAGDLMVFYATGDSGTATTYTIPSGWTQIFKYTSTTPKYMGAYKFATADEPPSYNFGLSSGADGHSVMHTIKDVDTTKAPVFASATSASSNTVHRAPSVTPNASRGLLICFTTIVGAENSTISWTPPTGMTEEHDYNQKGWASITTASQRWDSTTATGQRSFGLTTSNTAKAGYGSSIFIPSAI